MASWTKVFTGSMQTSKSPYMLAIYVHLIQDTMWPFCHRCCCCIRHQKNTESKSFNKNNRRLLSSSLEHCGSICMTCRAITLLWIIYKYVGIAKQLYMSSAKSKTSSQMQHLNGDNRLLATSQQWQHNSEHTVQVLSNAATSPTWLCSHTKIGLGSRQE